MIYTLTANPAIDYHMDLTDSGFLPGEINRSAKEEMFPGGKGLNVSIILAELGIDSIAWGFIAGKTGSLLEELAGEKGCRCDFIRLPAGETRINVKLDCALETAVNGRGPRIGEDAARELIRKAKGLSSGDTLILSGNLQTGTVNLYEALCRETAGKNIRLIVDTEGENLKKTFPYHPFLIKPNEEELLDLYESTDRSTASVVSLMMRCQEDGAQNVMVTMGGDGALFLSRAGELYQAGIGGEHKVISTVGAGDSAIAGFLAGLSRYQDSFEEALRLGCAAGTATACRRWLAKGAQIEEAAADISVKRL